MPRVSAVGWIWVYTVQTQDVFRSANDAIAEKGRELGWTFPGPFLCECSDPRCHARVELTLDAYAELRSHPGRYLLAPGHPGSGV